MCDLATTIADETLYNHEGYKRYADQRLTVSTLVLRNALRFIKPISSADK